MGVLSALAIPRITLQANWQLEVISRRMAADLRLVRQSAIFYGEPCRIDFYIHMNRYTLKLPDETQQVDLPEGVSFDGNTTFPGKPPTIQFNSLGRPSSGGTVILKAGKTYRYIIVTPVTGRVRISRIPPQHW